MEIRTPERPRDWMLLFLPAVVILLGTALGAVSEKRGNDHAILLFALMGAYLAGPLCIVAGFVLTKPNPRWHVRAGMVLLVAGIVAFLNYSIAIGGCLLVMR